MKMAIFGTLVFCLISGCLAETPGGASSSIEPDAVYMQSLTAHMTELQKEIAEKKRESEELKKVVADLETKQRTAKNVGTVGALAGNDTAASDAAAYAEKKKALDALIAQLKDLEDELALREKEKASVAYQAEKINELEQATADAAESADLAALLSALDNTDDEDVADTGVAAENAAALAGDDADTAA